MFGIKAVFHYFAEFPQAHVLWVGDAISHSHPFIPSPSAHILSQHQVLFQWAGSSCQMACVGASSSASVLLLTIALLLPKQNSCFHSPNNIKHWYSLVEQGSSPLGNPITATLPFSYHPLHLAYNCFPTASPAWNGLLTPNCQLSRTCSFLLP